MFWLILGDWDELVACEKHVTSVKNIRCLNNCPRPCNTDAVLQRVMMPETKYSHWLRNDQGIAYLFCVALFFSLWSASWLSRYNGVRGPLRDIFGLVTVTMRNQHVLYIFFLYFIVGLNRPKSPSLIEKHFSFFHPLPEAPNCCWKNRLHPAAVSLFQKQVISTLVGTWNPCPPAVTLQWREVNAC